MERLSVYGCPSRTNNFVEAHHARLGGVRLILNFVELSKMTYYKSYFMYRGEVALIEVDLEVSIVLVF